MIKGFEEYTSNLTDEEKDIAREVWRILDKTNAPMTNKEICKKLAGTGLNTSAPRLRKMINWMHIKGHLPRLIATSKGYHFAKNRQELSDYAESLKGRIMAIEGRWKRTIQDLKEWT